ncbi:hypothetical protein Rfer_4416 (plasmid) [Rhodoferax ferrireducens T118]|uniref:Uncharacterized protein n=1 Tax=Albidiferax ferrireducens (strain ATCC BAA-621 / DSM 15236 / T118) TaxID=338969 RepID=Q21Q43_ALBFT|nr:hypothetical protein [Rhodoferax ferrireducens]ABD72102.1 hypothetical protein Rfer_4416 [Rhodoferax ferrireducens T118]
MRTIIFGLCAIAIALIAGVATPAELSAIAEVNQAKVLTGNEALGALKREATPVALGQIIKDPGGCLYAVVSKNKRLTLIQVRDKAKRQVCGN